jgi:hypothetical protein
MVSPFSHSPVLSRSRLLSTSQSPSNLDAELEGRFALFHARRDTNERKCELASVLRDVALSHVMLASVFRTIQPRRDLAEAAQSFAQLLPNRLLPRYARSADRL